MLHDVLSTEGQRYHPHPPPPPGKRDMGSKPISLLTTILHDVVSFTGAITGFRHFSCPCGLDKEADRRGLRVQGEGRGHHCACLRCCCKHDLACSLFLWGSIETLKCSPHPCNSVYHETTFLVLGFFHFTLLARGSRSSSFSSTYLPLQYNKTFV